MSVSTFWMSSGAVTPLRLVNSGMPAPPDDASMSRITGPAESTASLFSPLSSADSGAPATPGVGISESSSSRTSERRPVTAAAAAIAGEQRWVRPPAPWRRARG